MCGLIEFSSGGLHEPPRVVSSARRRADGALTSNLPLAPSLLCRSLFRFSVVHTQNRSHSYNKCTAPSLSLPRDHRCFFALALIRASNVGVRIGEFSSWKGFKRVCVGERRESGRKGTRSRRRASDREAHLDVSLPGLLKEESDPVVVLYFM
jgi:hypothetical protein